MEIFIVYPSVKHTKEIEIEAKVKEKKTAAKQKPVIKLQQEKRC